MITLIITTLNEGDELLKTIESLYESAEGFELIIVDDGSEKPVKVPKKYPAKLIRNNKRLGIQKSRDLGAKHASGKFIGLLNSRMRFVPGWLDKLTPYLEKENQTVFCTTSVVLWQDQVKELEKELPKVKDEDLKKGYKSYIEKVKRLKNLDKIDEEKERKYGAEIIDYSGSTVFQVNWIDEKKGKDVYEIPCVLGANYFMSKKWYNYIGGLGELHSYGSCEEFMSSKTWAFGGKVKIIKSIEIGNLYRAIKTYVDNVEDIAYNKLYILFTLYDWNTAYKIMHKFKYSEFKEYYRQLQTRLIKEMPRIMERRNFYNRKKINSIEHLITKKGK